MRIQRLKLHSAIQDGAHRQRVLARYRCEIRTNLRGIPRACPIAFSDCADAALYCFGRGASPRPLGPSAGRVSFALSDQFGYHPALEA